jgi:7-carboxy-7-deazaguanine synthase
MEVSREPAPCPRGVGRALRDAAMLTVNEIFYSIQGESTFSGRPCVFVRLTACDLRCTWCDTPYAFHEGIKMALDAVLAEVQKHDCPLVEITGGEPLLQREVYPLMERLLALGKTVLLETGGHVALDQVPPGVVKVMDVKCPGSGEAHRNDWTNIDRLTRRDEVKFVIADRVDYEFARDVVRRFNLAGRCGAVLFSPVHATMDLPTLAAWIMADALPVRLQVQLHKYIWGADVRGV